MQDVGGNEGKGGKRSVAIAPIMAVAAVDDDDEEDETAGPSTRAPSQRRKRNSDNDGNDDDAQSVHSIEDPTEFDLQAMADAQLVRDIEAAFALAPDDAHTSAYDSEPPSENDVPFTGYFTTYGKVKELGRKKAPVILGLVMKCDRMGPNGKDYQGKAPRNVLQTMDLERLPVYKKQKRA